jgi:hypothetical protein
LRAFGLLFLGLFLAVCGVGCSSPPVHFSASGTVRNVWCHDGLAFSFCDVIFEHDSGPLQTLTFYGTSVPLWAGLHVKLEYHSGDGPVDGLDYALRDRR